jgi:hypothetical protein
MTNEDRLHAIEQRLRELEQRIDALPLQRLAEAVTHLDGRLDLRALVRQQLLRASELSRELADVVAPESAASGREQQAETSPGNHVHIE